MSQAGGPTPSTPYMTMEGQNFVADPLNRSAMIMSPGQQQSYNTADWGLPGYTAPPGGLQSASSLLGMFGSQLSGMVPQSQSAPEMTAQAMAADSKLPAWMQMSAAQNLVSPDTMSKFMQNYQQQYGNPAEAQMKTNLYSQGRDNSTFGGSQLGSMQSGDLFNSFQAGMGMQNQAMQNWMGARQSFFGNEGQMAQEANRQNINRGLGVAGNAAQMGASVYNNQANSQNQYNLGAYNAMLSAQQQKHQQAMDNLNMVNSNRLQGNAQGMQHQQMFMQNPGSGSGSNVMY